jgi:hypothetical protein
VGNDIASQKLGIIKNCTIKQHILQNSLTEVRLSIIWKTFYGDYNQTRKMCILKVHRGKKWLKNDPDLLILRQNSAPKIKLHKFAQEMNTVDGGGYPRLYLSAKETLVIFGYNMTLYSTDLRANDLNF